MHLKWDLLNRNDHDLLICISVSQVIRLVQSIPSPKAVIVSTTTFARHGFEEEEKKSDLIKDSDDY